MTVQPLRALQPLPAATTSWPDYLDAALAEEWRPHEWDPQSWVFTGDVNEPLTAVSICITPACDTPIDGTHGRCNACRKAIVRYASPADFDRSYDPSWRRAGDSRYLTARQFSLADRSPLMRSEVLFALQQRDQDRQTLRPWLLAKLMEKIDPDTSSILDVGEAGLNASQLGLLRSLQLQVNRLRMAFLGEDGTSGEVWDVALVGLRSAPNRPYRAVFGTLHFRGIRQHWLRDIVLEVTRARRPSVTEAHRDVQAAEIASAALFGRPHSDKPEALGLADMTEIYRAFKTARDPDTGELYSVTYRRGLLGSWRRLLSFARSAELMDHVPGSFALTADHQIKPEETNEDEIGRAIPEEWIAQLDKHLPLLGSTSTYANGGWAAEDYAAMYQTVYALLRDTGRRPNEIVGLPRNPSEYRDGEPLLVWDNGKARRLRRRLPIDESTAEIIKIWEKRLATLPVPPACRGLLFPAPGGRNQARPGHLAPNQFRKMFVAWLAVVPDPEHLPADSLGFSRDDIEPYGLRHAYAQRHADNGTPVDVLRELMDHKSVDTTMGYYAVSLKRKQAAVKLVASLAVDRRGRPSPFGSELAYERSSVAVPYGNCTEPTNVKAGGKSCAIRFQCSGCGYFRPDPSYLAAIEQHIEQLRADRAIALAADADDWVIDNLDAQIRSFAEVADKMQQQLVDLPEAERAAVETACRELRKARQAPLISADSLLRKPGAT